MGLEDEDSDTMDWDDDDRQNCDLPAFNDTSMDLNGAEPVDSRSPGRALSSMDDNRTP